MNRICFTLFCMGLSLNLFSQMTPGQTAAEIIASGYERENRITIRI